jgi:H+/Cl- antiporter ClcA
MKELASSSVGARWPSFPNMVTSAIGVLLGGFTGAALIIVFTSMLKWMLAVISRQPNWVLVVAPLLGLGLSVLVLYGFGLTAETPAEAASPGHSRWASRWRTFPPGVARSDITADIVTYAGVEERLPWRLAPIRVLAIIATVGLGGPMGTEAPAAYLGLADGAALTDRGRWLRRCLRSAALAGGSAGVSALMGIPLVGPAYVLEMGHRNEAPVTFERMTAALLGGVVGWLMNIALGVNLIRLVVPREPPHTVSQALITIFLIGALGGSITGATGATIHRAKVWKAHPVVRLAIGGLALAVAAILLIKIASPQAAVGPGGGAINWVESSEPAVLTVLAVALLRAVATTAAAAAGGCGGLFVPFLAVGDLAGRVFAAGTSVGGDLAGASGAASGIAGGYRLPFTAVALVVCKGGAHLATLTCLGTVVVATFAGAAVASAMERLLHRPVIEKKADPG